VTPEEYNYAAFPLDMDDPVFEAFPTKLRVGQRAPDPQLHDLAAGKTMRLSEVTRLGLTVLEFGSLT